MRALGVLALIFLSFAQVHAEGMPGHDILTVAVDLSFCGDAPPATDNDHAPCHACRFDPVTLPPAAGGIIRTPQATKLVLAALVSTGLCRVATGLPAARGPPRLA